MEDSLFIGSSEQCTLFKYMIDSRTDFIFLERLLNKDNLDIMSIIAIHSFLDDLITTLCKMYDFESKEWNILDEAETINNKIKENNKNINTSCNEKLELEKLIGKDKYHKSEEYIKLFNIKYHISVHKNSYSNEIFNKLLKDNILEFLEPFIVYAEKLNDCSEYHKRIRKEVMDNFIKRLEEEEVKNGK